MMQNRHARILALVVGVVAFFTLVGWMADIPFLKSSIIPGTITTKFITALSFLISAAMVYIIRKDRPAPRDPVLLWIGSLLVMFFMATSLISQLAGIHTGIELIFVKEAPGEAQTSLPGAPSIGTIVSFLLIVIAAVASSVSPAKNRVSWIGGAVVVIGGIAIAGYLLGIPALHYSWGSWTNPIAFKTAALFVLLGIALMRAREEGIRQ